MHSVNLSPDVVCFPLGGVNAYGILGPEGSVLVDTGMSFTVGKLQRAWDERFGPPPRAIVLTHGHQDHSGGAAELARRWSIPLYVHPLERAFVDGRSRYPDPDPTSPGPMGLLCRFMPWPKINPGREMLDLPADGSVPFLPGWKWLHVPGHAPGQVALWQESDRVALVGDAFSTADFDSWSGILSQRPTLGRPVAAITCDWELARLSVLRIAMLHPEAVGAGHGPPRTDPGLAQELVEFAQNLAAPLSGRYVPRPALTDENGVVSLPPRPPDPLPRRAAVVLAAAGLVAASAKWERRQRRLVRESNLTRAD